MRVAILLASGLGALGGTAACFFSLRESFETLNKRIQRLENPRPKPKPWKIILVRHGQSEGNVDEKMYETIPDNEVRLGGRRGKQKVHNQSPFFFEKKKRMTLTSLLFLFSRKNQRFDSRSKGWKKHVELVERSGRLSGIEKFLCIIAPTCERSKPQSAFCHNSIRHKLCKRCVFSRLPFRCL